MKSLTVELKTTEDVKAILAVLLNQVLDKQNYDLVVAGEIHFEECEPDELGYVVGSFSFSPWGADAFDCMENMISKTVQENYMSIVLNVTNVQIELEERVRDYFNETFKGLDEARSAGTIYVGDNGECIARYLDVDAQQLADIIANWERDFSDMMVTIYRTDDCSADVSIC